MPNGEASAAREENLKALEKFKELITEHCRKTGCTVENLSHVWSDGWKTPKTKVTYPDGWWFMANLDPSVLEFQTKEMTIKELEQLKPRIESDIFGICKEIGLAPKAGVGGGHIHIDLVSAFPEDGKLLRDFIVDFANHPGLAYGALSKENGNATPVAKLRSDQKVAFRKVISDFDTGLIVGRDQLAEAIERRVYYHSPAYANPPSKYMAINLTRINNKDIPAKERTVEIRSIRAQQSPEELKQIGEIFENRINFLKNQAVSSQIGSLLPPTNDKEIVQQYHSYLEGTQLDVKNYQNLLPEKYKKISINMTSSNKCLSPVIQTLDKLLH